MGGSIMRPLPGDLFTLLVKDCQLPLEHLGVPRGRVPNRGEAYDQRGMRSQARSWEYVTVSDGYGDRVNRARAVAWDQAGMVFLCRLVLTIILTCKAWRLCK
jgi:hypothetical protein